MKKHVDPKNSSLNIFSTEQNLPRNTVASYSKEKYSQNFSSNIFFTTPSNPVGSTVNNGKIKVNRINKKPINEFKPKYKNNEINPLQRKMNQLQGSSSGILSTQNSSTIIKNRKKSESNRNTPTTSLGFYKKEQERSFDFRGLTAKERYYASVSNSNTFNNKKVKERSSSMQNIKFTNEKISRMDNSKVEFKNDSRQFLFDNLYSNKIFHNNVSYLSNIIKSKI